MQLVELLDFFSYVMFTFIYLKDALIQTNFQMRNINAKFNV